MPPISAPVAASYSSHAHAPSRRIFNRLRISEELLTEIAVDLEPEDGVLWVHDSTEEGCYGFTLFGLESVQEILNDKPTLAFIKERMERDNSK